ncbi:Gfo/Idh/MocA family protein [Nocardiopsis aegyptia]|uniref:Putative dehydrogenase n=1 Tax=Nocardiopsis aegyptia TaxID=220378 RepID=A0A7Z0JEB7_9ACTN|nr:Gfo/Idh/MocA family oxidoreductase [Nocardiopsis aegyptia]NYJ38254.1 putative dehydrogenase [Nocardiopsis aegyptia]
MDHVNLTDHLGAALGRPLTLAVVGAGARGRAYARMAADTGAARVVAVAEPDRARREDLAHAFGISGDHAFTGWAELAARPRLADAAVVATLDHDHLGAATALAGAGYDLLLEKPVATTEADCDAIGRAVERAGVTAAVCHVLRYTPYTSALRALVESGAIGEVVSVQHLEPVGHAHFAHSYVRGNWHDERTSGFSLLTKSCHDVDWLAYLVGRPVARVSSFGGLHHFRPEHRPAGAADRCVHCPRQVEAACPYSAARMYRDGLREDSPHRHFTQVMAGELTSEAVERALRHGDYGRCVYGGHNDVADHQVVNLEFDGGATASFTMTAFTPMEDRRTTVFGTRGQVTGDGRHVHHFDFLTGRTTTTDTWERAPEGPDGHGGGDAGLVAAFVAALHQGRPELIRSGLAESIATHRVVFAAERARRQDRVVVL